MTEVYDFAAIGAGPAGESAPELAAFYGRRSVVIEKNRPGGTVTTTGGAPTKTLRDRLMPAMDGEMSRRMDDLFRMWRLTVVLGATADTITRTAPRILEVVLSTGAKFQPDTLLFAAGRVANTDKLDLDAAGVKTDSLGRILVDEHFRTSVESIFAAGEVLGPHPRIHSDATGRAAACHALNIDEVSMNTPTYRYAYKYAAFDAFRRLGLMHRTTLRDHVVPAYES